MEQTSPGEHSQGKKTEGQEGEGKEPHCPAEQGFSQAAQVPVPSQYSPKSQELHSTVAPQIVWDPQAPVGQVLLQGGGEPPPPPPPPEV